MQQIVFSRGERLFALTRCVVFFFQFGVINPDDFLDRKTEQPKQEPTYEQKAENEFAHQQNVSAFIPGGTTIADVDK